LTRIMDNVCGDSHPPVIISKFLNTRHDIRKNLVTVREYKCILDVLRFDNTVVYNAFIDQVRKFVNVRKCMFVSYNNSLVTVVFRINIVD
jgi:hypothetical protein